jgi:hypothetical protein
MFNNFIGKHLVFNINSYVVRHQRGNNCASLLDAGMAIPKHVQLNMYVSWDGAVKNIQWKLNCMSYNMIQDLWFIIPSFLKPELYVYSVPYYYSHAVW